MEAEHNGIQVKNLTLSRGGRLLFQDFSLNIPPGAKALLDAPSGTGKTTLLRLLLGFEPFTHGSVSVGGVVLNRKELHKLRSRVAYLSQSIDLSNAGTVAEGINEVLSYDANRHISLTSGELDSRLDEWELHPGCARAKISSLSGGERQRVGIALLEILDRPIWILDEPTAALDEKRCIAAADRLLSDSHRTILTVSHDPYWKQKTHDLFITIPSVGEQS